MYKNIKKNDLNMGGMYNYCNNERHEVKLLYF